MVSADAGNVGGIYFSVQNHLKSLLAVLCVRHVFCVTLCPLSHCNCSFSFALKLAGVELRHGFDAPNFVLPLVWGVRIRLRRWFTEMETCVVCANLYLLFLPDICNASGTVVVTIVQSTFIVQSF